MKLFSKIYISVLASFIVVFFTFVFISTQRQITEAEHNIITQYQTIGDFIAQEVKVGYLESRWPFENLNQIGQRDDFLFWWIVDSGGKIYLADKSEFMGSPVSNYFPDVTASLEGKVIINRDRNYGLYIKTVDASKIPWTFVLGFSLKGISELQTHAIRTALVSFLVGAGAIGALLYVVVRHFTQPIQALVKGANVFANGDFSYRLNITTRDELGRLGAAFNDMAVRLKDFYATLEEKVRQRTEEVETARMKLETLNTDLASKVDELERLNKTMVGRELKMIELKEKLQRYESEPAISPTVPVDPPKTTTD